MKNSPPAETVFTHYCPWYNEKTWKRRVHHPQAGEYNSLTKETIARHSQLGSEAGIDVFAQEWSGRGVASDGYDTERAFQTVLDGLQALRSPVKVTPLYAYYNIHDPKVIVNDMCHFVKTYGSHPQLFQSPFPVLFVYVCTLQEFTPEQWKKIIREVKSRVDVILMADYCWDKLDGMFDGLWNYNPGLHAAYGGYAPLMKKCRWDVAQANGQISVATVVPGFDAVAPVHTCFDRKNGEVYRRGWSYAMASHAPWVFITSFNEWYEGSEIEPSKEYGRLYIDITKEMSGAFKNMPPEEQVRRYFRPNAAPGEQWDLRHADNQEIIRITIQDNYKPYNGITGFYRLNGALASSKTKVLLHYDESALHVRMVCHEECINELAITSREKLTYSHDDSVEILIVPGDKEDQFYHFMINAAGATDVYHNHAVVGNLERQCAALRGCCKTTVRVEKNAWVCDVVIPFQILGKTPKKGNVWRMQFCRNRPGKSKCQLETATAFPTFGDYLVTERFGFFRYE